MPGALAGIAGVGGMAEGGGVYTTDLTAGASSTSFTGETAVAGSGGNGGNGGAGGGAAPQARQAPGPPFPEATARSVPRASAPPAALVPWQG